MEGTNAVTQERPQRFFFQGISMKKALTTGITGQDGNYLAELLLL
jgi:hypothetical protein